jgi:hypothetical protein
VDPGADQRPGAERSATGIPIRNESYGRSGSGSGSTSGSATGIMIRNESYGRNEADPEADRHRGAQRSATGMMIRNETQGRNEADPGESEFTSHR